MIILIIIFLNLVKKMDNQKTYQLFFIRIMSCLKKQAKDKALTIEDLEIFKQEFMKGLSVQLIANIEVKEDSKGNYYHPSTKIVFNYDNPFAYAIGRKEGKIVQKLTEDDIYVCVSNGWAFDPKDIDDETIKKLKKNKEVLQLMKK